MDRDDAHADWSPQDIAWDGLTLTAQNSSGTDANVPTIDRYYVKGRGAASSGSTGATASSGCRVPGCTSDLSRDLAYFRKYRICREHLKSPVLLVEGVPSRFCQQCSRFHHVKEFDGPQRTCRAMLERLRIKRNRGKTQAGGQSGSRAKNDTHPTDASRRAGSSSRSNSTGKDAEDLAPGQQQQPSAAGLAATDSGEGVDSVAALGVAAPRRSASTATASSIPGQFNQQNPSHYHNPLGHQTLVQLRQRQGSLPQAQAGHLPAGSRLSDCPGGLSVGALSRGGSLDEQHELLQLYLSQDTALTPSHRGLLGADGAAAEALARDVRMADYDAPDRQELPDRAATASLDRNAQYGLSSGVACAAGGGSLRLGSRPGVASASAMYLEDLPLRHQQQPVVEPLRRRERETRLQLAGSESAREDSLLLQLALPRGYGDGGGRVPPHARVLDLGQPPAPAPVGPVLNLGSRVDLSLELQLQDIYREMEISDGAAPAPQRQGHPLSSVGSGRGLLGRSSATFPPEPLVSQGHCAAAPTSMWPGERPAPVFGAGQQQFAISAVAASSPRPGVGLAAVAALRGAATGPLLSAHQQQQQQQQQAFNELAAAMRLSGSTEMDLDLEQLPMSLAAGNAAPALGLARKEAMSRRDSLLQLQHQPPKRQEQLISITGASGDGVAHQHFGSRVYGSLHGSQAVMTKSLAALDRLTPGGDNAATADHSGHCGRSSDAVVSLPEAGDTCASWCGADDIDAALDMLMAEAGSGAVYHQGANAASLERICFKLHNLHPCDFPSDLMFAMSSWLAGARTEVVQGAVRPGCTQLILDVYARSPDPDDRELAEGDGTDIDDKPGGSSLVSLSFRQQTSAEASPPPPSPSQAPSVASVTEENFKAPAEDPRISTKTIRVLGGVMPSESELARLEAAAAAAGAEALEPIATPACSRKPSTSAECHGRFQSGDEGNITHLSAYVMHNGNVRAATACFKKLLGPRAVQSMSVSISHEVMTISSRDMGRHVADVRGTIAGMDTPLLFSVSPVAVLAGVQAEVNVIGSHLSGPGRRPQLRCQGVHISCNVKVAPEGADDGSVHQLRPYEAHSLVPKLVANTLPGGHRASAMAGFAAVELQLEVPETAGLMMLEWEADRSLGGVAISDWLPLLSVPDAAMAVDINKLGASMGVREERFWSFIQDLGLVLDYVTRINHGLLMPISELMTTQEDAGAGDDEDENGTVTVPATGGCNTTAGDAESLAGGSGDGSGPGLPADAARLAWQNRSCGGGDDQRKSQVAGDGPEGGEQQCSLEHDSRVELMARPRLSKRHYTRVTALVPPLLAFAADSGMPAVISWLMDFLLEHMYFGDLAAVFQCVEAVGGPAGLPLLHRAVRSGNARAVRLLLHRAASHGLACNLAQPAGPFNITPLHLAALQPIQSGMLQACGCAEPAVAQLWVSVPDAAGRTPAMYLRRQLESSARGVTPATSGATTALHAAAAVIASGASPAHRRSSTSSSTTGTAYRSWGSDDPPDASMAVAGAPYPRIMRVVSGVSLPAASGDLPISREHSCAVGFSTPPRNLQSSSARRSDWNGGRRDSASGVYDGGESSMGRDPARALDTMEIEFSTHREMAQGGGQLSEGRGADTGLGVGPSANQQPGGSEAGLGHGSLLQSLATAACGVLNERGSERAGPLRVLGQAHGGDCSEAVLSTGEWHAKGLELHTPVAGGLAPGIHPSSASERHRSRAPAWLGPRPEASGGTDVDGFPEDPREGCLKIKSEVRLRRKMEPAAVKSGADEGSESSGAGGDGDGAATAKRGFRLPGRGDRRDLGADVPARGAKSGFEMNLPWLAVVMVLLMFALLVVWWLSSSSW